jgi:hypothetical protein
LNPQFGLPGNRDILVLEEKRFLLNFPLLLKLRTQILDMGMSMVLYTRDMSVIGDVIVAETIIPLANINSNQSDWWPLLATEYAIHSLSPILNPKMTSSASSQPGLMPSNKDFNGKNKFHPSFL